MRNWFDIFKRNLIMATIEVVALFTVIGVGLLIAFTVVRCFQFSVWLGVLSVIASFLLVVGIYSYAQYIEN